MKELSLILHDIRSAYNVGAIFRTADGAGVSKIYLSGYTPIPVDKAKLYKTKADKMLEKTALGAEKTVPWERVENIEMLTEKLKGEDVLIAALEKVDHSIEIKKFIDENSHGKIALILGNEVDGVSADILQRCDVIISLPMRGMKESLNVSVAAGIAMYELLS